MKKSYYIIASIVSVLFIAVIVIIVQFNNDNDVETSTSNEGKKLNERYSDKQIKVAKQRRNIESQVDKKMREYINNTVAPRKQEDYDNALKMRSQEDRKTLSEDVKDIVKDKKRTVKNLNLEIQFKDSQKIEGNYYYTLVTSNDDATTSEDKSGDFKIDTNTDGYFYIKEFN
ncbi:hypothetical protein [Staphylococcus simulans]